MAPAKLLLLVCISLGTCVSAPLHAQSDRETITASSEGQSAEHPIRSGRLANGLRYIIIPRRSQAFQDTSKVALRMRVDGGWPAEGPGENGLVHLIEHLPLDGNARMSGEEVATFRDHHTDVREWGAFTSPYASEYFLTTQTNDQSVIIDALRYLSGIAIGLPISAEGVERQRPIVINEMAGRLAEAMPEHIARANARRSAVRSAVEHVFAGQKHRMGLFIRTIGIARARTKIGMANLAYNFQRLA